MFLFLAAAAAATAPASAAVERPAPTPVISAYDAQGKRLVLTVGETIIIRIWAHRSDDHRWKLEPVDGLEQLGEPTLYTAPASEGVGFTHAYDMKVRATRTGVFKVKIVNVHKTTGARNDWAASPFDFQVRAVAAEPQSAPALAAATQAVAAPAALPNCPGRDDPRMEKAFGPYTGQLNKGTWIYEPPAGFTVMGIASPYVLVQRTADGRLQQVTFRLADFARPSGGRLPAVLAERFLRAYPDAKCGTLSCGVQFGDANGAGPTGDLAGATVTDLALWFSDAQGAGVAKVQADADRPNWRASYLYCQYWTG
jgi:hypothetical protein